MGDRARSDPNIPADVLVEDCPELDPSAWLDHPSDTEPVGWK